MEACAARWHAVRRDVYSSCIAGTMSAPSVIVESSRPWLAEEAARDCFVCAEAAGSAMTAESWEMDVPESWLTGLLADWDSYDVAEFHTRDQPEHCSAHGDGHQLHVVQAAGKTRIPFLCR